MDFGIRIKKFHCEKKINSFKSKALRLFWEKNDSNKLPKQLERKTRILLQIIDELENFT